MGSVTVKYSVSDGQTLSKPQISMPPNTYCDYLNEQGTILYRWKPTVYNYDQIEVTEGQVTFHGPDAFCKNMKAEAMVAGSKTTFGNFDIEVISGVDIIIDIGGPTVFVDIEPNTQVDTDSIEVTGTATDDTEVTLVTVNGVTAILSSTNNPDDPNEVSFIATVPLNKGENTIQTIARDSSDKQSSDSRNVFNDGEVPTLTFTPDDGTDVYLPTTSVTINGTTSDDVDIKSVTINGAAITLTKLAQGSYSFSSDLNVDGCGAYPCSTDIIVISTDVSGRTTTETHTVILQDSFQDTTGPVLLVDLEDGSFVSTEEISVTGVVTDDVKVETVVINGITASLSPLVDTDDPNDKSFSATISLQPGNNEIVTTASDSSGNTSSISRTVIYDVTPPALSFTPADGTVVNNVTSMVVDGIATDDFGISSITINDQAVIVNEDGSFSLDLPLQQCGLAPCDTDITVIVTDVSGLTKTETHTVTLITNIEPSVGTITVSPDVVSVGETAFAEADFSDPNLDDSHTAIWDWSDGTQCDSETDQNCSVGNATTSASHTYTESGIYVVKVTISDSQGETASTSYKHVVVYDKNSGHVTGGGNIISPAGAYVADPQVTGKASFGFVAKYKKSKAYPKGQTQFKFHIGHMKFHSTKYSWLVTKNEVASFVGKGKVNGKKGYGFMISVVDARLTEETDLDLFRVRIWNEATAEVLYDTQLGDDIADAAVVPICKGSIVIHHKGQKSKSGNKGNHRSDDNCGTDNDVDDDHDGHDDCNHGDHHNGHHGCNHDDDDDNHAGDHGHHHDDDDDDDSHDGHHGCNHDNDDDDDD